LIQPNIYITRPGILSKKELAELNISVLADDEVFCESQYQGYVVSSYGRVYSMRRRKLMKPTLLGREKNRPAYTLRSDINDRKSIVKPAAALVGEIFCKNDYPGKKVVWHHIDYNPLNNRWDNLIAVPYRVHSALHTGRRTFLLDNRSGTLSQFASIHELSDYLCVDYHKVERAVKHIRLDNCIAVMEDSIGIVQVAGVRDADNLPIFVGCKLNNDNADNSEECVEIIGLLPQLFELNRLN